MEKECVGAGWSTNDPSLSLERVPTDCRPRVMKISSSFSITKPSDYCLPWRQLACRGEGVAAWSGHQHKALTEAAFSREGDPTKFLEGQPLQ